MCRLSVSNGSTPTVLFSVTNQDEIVASLLLQVLWCIQHNVFQFPSQLWVTCTQEYLKKYLIISAPLKLVLRNRYVDETSCKLRKELKNINLII